MSRSFNLNSIILLELFINEVKFRKNALAIFSRAVFYNLNNSSLFPYIRFIAM